MRCAKCGKDDDWTKTIVLVETKKYEDDPVSVFKAELCDECANQMVEEYFNCPFGLIG